MRTYRINFIRFAALMALVLHCSLGLGQVLPNAPGTSDLNRLENSIKEKQTLAQARVELDAIYRKAAAAGDDIVQARSLNYLIVVRDQLTEDSLYFRNSAVIDTLLRAAKTSAKLKTILYVMQARRLGRFNQQLHNFNIATYRLKNANTDYAALNAEQRWELSGKYLDSALTGAGAFNKTEAGQLMWLSATPDVFLFEPQLEDIVLAEKVNQVAFVNRYVEDSNKVFVDMLAMPGDLFAHKLDSLGALKLNGSKTAVLNAYRNWMAFHKNNEPIRAFIESIARKSIYLSLSGDSVAGKAYTQYLLNSINSPYDVVSAHAVYQLCLLWNQEGNKYKDFKDKYRYWGPGSAQPFNPRYQFLPAKALQLYWKHRLLIEKYPAFKQVLEIMAKQIQAKALRIEMDGIHLPENAIRLKATYKNTDTLYYRVIKISAEEPAGKGTVIVTDALLKRPGASSGKFALPLPADNNVHAIYLKLDKLPAGRYRLLFSYNPINVFNDALNDISFNVTNIIALNTDERVFVLDRKGGYPLAGARIQAFYKKKAVVKGVVGTVPAAGYLTIKEGLADSISISYKGDTIGYNINAMRTGSNRDVFDTDSYDDLTEFHDDKVNMQIFTDRGIYRPGQTVQYKIIFLTQHPKTGETILFNKQNLGGGIFKTRLKEWLDDGNNMIQLRDAFGKKIDSTRLAINEFGSFAGQFILPKTAATGRWSIDGKPNTAYTNDGSFKVEEYKRPSIELSMEKQQKVFLPGEPFTVKLKLRSFNGSDLNNIPVKYSIQRYGNFPVRSVYSTVKIVDTTGYTNAQGELMIPVNDTAFANVILSDSLFWRYDYGVKAQAVDMTGESAETNGAVEVYSHPVNINVNLSGLVDRWALPQLNVSASDLFAGDVSRKVNVRIYKTGDPQQAIPIQKQVDQLYNPDITAGFPEGDESKMMTPRQLVLDTTVNTADNEKLKLDSENFPAGFYEVEAITRDGGFIRGKTQHTFTVFDSKAGKWVGRGVDHIPFNSVKTGARVTWFGAGRSDNFTIYRSAYINKNNKTVARYVTYTEKAGVRQWNYTVPEDAKGQVLLTRISVINNQVIYSEQRIYVREADRLNPQIIVERYRRVMAPGAEEKFSVSVKTKNDNIAAELMTSLYDASLDKLAQHNWLLPQTNTYGPYLYVNWNKAATAQLTAEFFSPDMAPVNLFKTSALERENGVLYELEGRAAGLNITNASGLDEVVVMGYGTLHNASLAEVNIVTIRGSSSIDDILKKLPGIEVDAAGNVITLGRTATQARLNGKDYVGGDLRTLTRNLPADILDRFQVIDNYGNQASLTGIKSDTVGKILSFTISPDGGKINILLEPPPAVIKIRKTFNETAFFFPQIHADKAGYYTFNFTMPETATEWNWKVLAHTRDARFAYIEKKLQTQLNLMVQPNMPRLVYQGDKIKLPSRISNLDTLAIQGKATLKIEDAVTGEDITSLLSPIKETAFSLDRKSSGAVAFMLNIPTGQINPLKVVITVTGGGAADAEEHFIPVLSSKVFIRQSVPVRFDDKAAITINKPKLPADAIGHGVGISITQKPQASLIYALPWLANYSFDCAEQTFNKLRAQATALKLMRTDTSVQRAYKAAKAFIEKNQPKTDALPDEMAEETMLWLKLANNTAAQQKQLFSLLDTAATRTVIDKHLQKLAKLQKPDGGLMWFEGGNSNPYISAYVLAGFGQLKQMGFTANPNNPYVQRNLLEKLIKFNQDKLLSDQSANTDRLYLLYALSYWQKDNPLSSEQLLAVNSILEKEWSSIAEKNLQQQALLIVNTIRYLPAAGALRAKADEQLENIRQMAVQDDLNGIRWKAIADAENMNSSAEETMALLAEAFEQSGKYNDVQTGITKWLLIAKQQQHWQTTKATAAAINMLQKQKSGAMGATKAFSADLSGKQLNVSDDLLDGRPADFFAAKESPSSIMLKQTGTNAAGAVTWYYFAKPDALDTLNKAVKISKQFFVYDASRNRLRAVSPGTVLKAGESLQVKLTVEAAVSLQYVHINDPRAALFEPAESASGYRYTTGTGYYQSVRDTGVELFTEAIPRGITEFTYDVVVAHSGEFSSGPATLQCMYQPAVTAYSGTQNFNAE